MAFISTIIENISPSTNSTEVVDNFYSFVQEKGKED